MRETRSLLVEATALLATVAGTDFAALTDEAVCQLMVDAEAAGRYLDAIRALTAGEVEDRSRKELGRDGLSQRLGFTRGAQLTEHLTRVSPAEATRRNRLGTAIRPRLSLTGDCLPPAFRQVAVAMTCGLVGTDAARDIIHCLSQAARTATPDQLEPAETALVCIATTEPADIVAVHARVWREHLDPDGATPRDEELRARRAFNLGRETGGLTPFSGAAEPVFAALLRSAFAETGAPGVSPRFLNEEDTLRGTETTITADGQIVETVRDPRSRPQHHYDVFAGLITAGLRKTEGKPGSMRATSTVMAVIQLKDLESGHGVGWLDDIREPVSAATVQELACDAGYRRIILGHHGEVLYLGTPERFFSTAQRKALAVRDGGCVWPSCTAPPSWCQAHHVIEYEHGGKTDIDNGALLCSAHHHMLHNSQFTMKMINGKPQLLAPPWLDPDQHWKPLGRTRATMVA